MKLTVPTGHGEMLMAPAYEDWGALARQSAAASQRWTFSVAGMPGQRLRTLARAEMLGLAVEYSARIGGHAAAAPRALDPDPLVVMTGHQPDLFHPGVWVKNFLVDRLARELGAVGLNLVVDSDAMGGVELRAPAMAPGLVVQHVALRAPPDAPSTFATSPPISAEELARFRAKGLAALDTLSARAIACHFREYCDVLAETGPQARELAEHLTFARRRYENRAAPTHYLEAPVTGLARGRAFLTFAADLALGAERFHAAYNGALGAHRQRSRTRSPAQPFPDLAVDPSRGHELPLWHLRDGGRTEVWVRTLADGARELTSEGTLLAVLPAEPHAAALALWTAAPRLAPKALALTAFHRFFVSDLFVHGVGGARYDRITDAFCLAYYGTAPPPFALASMTMFLPLGAKVVHQSDVEEVERKLERLHHNPDSLLDDEELDLEPADLARALALAAQKAGLVEKITAADADKRALGLRIREVNAALGELLRPAADALRAEVEALRAARAASALVADRTYPFCFWNPREIQDKAR